MNSFKNVEKAIEYEVERHREILESGGAVLYPYAKRGRYSSAFYRIAVCGELSGVDKQGTVLDQQKRRPRCFPRPTTAIFVTAG